MGKKKLSKKKILGEVALTYYIVSSPTVYAVGVPLMAIYGYIQDGLNKDYSSSGYPHLAAFRFYGTILLVASPITVPLSLAIDLVKLTVSPVVVPLMCWRKWNKMKKRLED